MKEIEATIQEIFHTMKSGHSAWVNYHLLDYVRSQLCFNLHKLIQALQAAHYCWLLINLLPSDRLKDLFDAAMVKAKAH
jgi:hypothetical protein